MAEGRTAGITKGAMRGLQLPLKEREAKLEAASPEVRKILEQEMAALQWVQAHYWVWLEQGVWEDVKAFLESDGAAEAQAA